MSSIGAGYVKARIHCVDWENFVSHKGAILWIKLIKQNDYHFADDIIKCILLQENVCILLKSWLKSVPKGQIDNKSALVQAMT